MTCNCTPECLECTAKRLASSQAAKNALLGYPAALKAGMRSEWPTPEQYRAGRIRVWQLIEAAKAKT